MNKFGFQCDKIVLIESLPDHEKQQRNGKLMSYGEHYVEEIFPSCNKLRSEPFAYELKTVNSALDLYQYMDLLCRKVDLLDEFPLIHFEVHGASSGDGIVTKNGDFIHWTSLLDKLRCINRASANNLFVVFATCSGVLNLNYIDIRKYPFPYYAAIAPDNPDLPIFLENKYVRFYGDFLVCGDIEAAFREVINKEGYSQIIPSTCECLLYHAFVSAIDIVRSNPNVSNIMDDFQRYGLAAHLDSEKVREIALKKIKDPILVEGILKSLKAKYLMADNPLNKDRFLFTVEELMTALNNRENS